MPRNVDLTFRQRKQTALPLPRTRPAFSGPPPPRDRAGPDNQQAQRSSPMHVSPASSLLSWRQPAKDANRLRVGGVLLRSPGAPSDSGMQRVPFCHLRKQKCNLLAPAGNSENWADMLPWHGSTKQEHPKEGHHGPSAQELLEQSPGRRRREGGKDPNPPQPPIKNSLTTSQWLEGKE